MSDQNHQAVPLATELEELKSENRQLKETVSELEQFVHTVSHDLKAPLSSLMGLVRLATEAPISEEMMMEYLGFMKKSVLQLDSFLQDLINYSRNVRMEVKEEQIEFKSFVEEIYQNLTHMSEAENVSLEVKVRDEINMETDYIRLKMILNNLISNSIFYNSGESDAFVRVFFDELPEGMLIQVADNGIGIEDKHLDDIFKMFYRVSTEGTGSGLGLYIVKEAVDKLNGEITVESKPGVGTTFKVFIPK